MGWRGTPHLVEVDRDGRRWAKSSASDKEGCVEMTSGDDTMLVRDSRDRKGPRLTFPTSAWTRFLARVRG
jgi:hypothetical protein